MEKSLTREIFDICGAENGNREYFALPSLLTNKYVKAFQEDGLIGLLNLNIPVKQLIEEIEDKQTLANVEVEGKNYDISPATILAFAEDTKRLARKVGVNMKDKMQSAAILIASQMLNSQKDEENLDLIKVVEKYLLRLRDEKKLDLKADTQTLKAYVIDYYNAGRDRSMPCAEEIFKTMALRREFQTIVPTRSLVNMSIVKGAKNPMQYLGNDSYWHRLFWKDEHFAVKDEWKNLTPQQLFASGDLAQIRYGIQKLAGQYDSNSKLTGAKNVDSLSSMISKCAVESNLEKVNPEIAKRLALSIALPYYKVEMLNSVGQKISRHEDGIVKMPSDEAKGLRQAQIENEETKSKYNLVPKESKILTDRKEIVSALVSGATTKLKSYCNKIKDTKKMTKCFNGLAGIVVGGGKTLTLNINTALDDEKVKLENLWKDVEDEAAKDILDNVTKDIISIVKEENISGTKKEFADMGKKATQDIINAVKEEKTSSSDEMQSNQ